MMAASDPKLSSAQVAGSGAETRTNVATASRREIWILFEDK
jgi:hypothetical protein